MLYLLVLVYKYIGLDLLLILWNYTLDYIHVSLLNMRQWATKRYDAMWFACFYFLVMF